jgi:hypothetical protein
MKNAMKAAKTNEIAMPQIPENNMEEIPMAKIEIESGELSPIERNSVERRAEKKSILRMTRNDWFKWTVRADQVEDEEQGSGGGRPRED